MALRTVRVILVRHFRRPQRRGLDALAMTGHTRNGRHLLDRMRNGWRCAVKGSVQLSIFKRKLFCGVRDRLRCLAWFVGQLGKANGLRSRATRPQGATNIGVGRRQNDAVFFLGHGCFWLEPLKSRQFALATEDRQSSPQRWRTAPCSR